jgi:hypothetical protein
MDLETAEQGSPGDPCQRLPRKTAFYERAKGFAPEGCAVKEFLSLVLCRNESRARKRRYERIGSRGCPRVSVWTGQDRHAPSTFGPSDPGLSPCRVVRSPIIAIHSPIGRGSGAGPVDPAPIVKVSPLVRTRALS